MRRSEEARKNLFALHSSNTYHSAHRHIAKHTYHEQRQRKHSYTNTHTRDGIHCFESHLFITKLAHKQKYHNYPHHQLSLHLSPFSSCTVRYHFLHGFGLHKLPPLHVPFRKLARRINDCAREATFAHRPFPPRSLSSDKNTSILMQDKRVLVIFM